MADTISLTQLKSVVAQLNLKQQEYIHLQAFAISLDFTTMHHFSMLSILCAQKTKPLPHFALLKRGQRRRPGSAS
jgi:hypothetical protein